MTMTQGEIAKLADGTVVVVGADVKNPEPDGRARHDWRKLAEVPEGTEFVVKVYEGSKKPGAEPAHIELRPVGTWSHQHLFLHRDGRVPEVASYAALTNALLPALTVGCQSVGSLARKHYTDEMRFSTAVVRELLRTGKLTLTEAEALYLADNERE